MEEYSSATPQASRGLYLYVLIVLGALLFGAVLYLRLQGVFACAADGYSADRFLAYCNAGGYADYDHGAYWLNLEPEAVQAAARADVLFLGNSRLQMGLSSRATEDWFDAAGLSFHMLGFGYDANEAFTGPLLGRLRPRARAYVINLDRFFVADESPPAATAMHDPLARRQHVEKRLWQHPHRWLCQRVPAVCGRQYAVFRSRRTGQYLPVAGPTEGQSVTFNPDVPTDVRDAYVGRARRFIERLGVSAECVILTQVPHVETRDALAEEVARLLGQRLVVPAVPDIRLYDGSHLDQASAERWSAAFLELSGEQIRSCVATVDGDAQEES